MDSCDWFSSETINSLNLFHLVRIIEEEPVQPEIRLYIFGLACCAIYPSRRLCCELPSFSKYPPSFGVIRIDKRLADWAGYCYSWAEDAVSVYILRCQHQPDVRPARLAPAWCLEVDAHCIRWGAMVGGGGKFSRKENVLRCKKLLTIRSVGYIFIYICIFFFFFCTLGTTSQGPSSSIMSREGRDLYCRWSPKLSNSTPK